MERLTRKSSEREMVWFIDRENNNHELEPCDMSYHHSGVAIRKLAEYEIAEEQGLLLKPKVALNSFVYWDSGYWGIIPYKVCNISYSIHGFCYEICAFKGDELLDDQEVADDDFGTYVFLTKEEAEQKLN